jgi:hypothetical protein
MQVFSAPDSVYTDLIWAEDTATQEENGKSWGRRKTEDSRLGPRSKSIAG